MSDKVRQRVREIGDRIVPQMFIDSGSLFAPLALKVDPTCTVKRDISYGDHERHKLDVFAPVADGTDMPVVIFVHGGGFIQGDKGGAAEPFYNNVGAWAVREGFIGITMTYRLAPDHQWPAGPQDIAAVVDWVRTNISDHGGNPAKIFVFGHSAGAAHVASYVALTDLHGSGPQIAGAIMLSGMYDIDRLEHGPFENAHYGTDTSRFKEQSSHEGLISSKISCLFTISEYDPPKFQEQALIIVQDWFKANGKWPRMLYLPDTNHMTGVLGIGTKNDALSDELSAFIKRSGSES